jgi:hypothetical protein
MLEFCDTMRHIHLYQSRLRHYGTSRKAEGSRLDEIIAFSLIYLIFTAALGPGIYSAFKKH